MFLPTTAKELHQLGWKTLDVILVTGDSYIDSPFIGVALIGKLLRQAGFRVGVIAQPDVRSESDIRRLGEPTLFWGITGGSVDSLVANYTPLKKRRRSDDFTPGGVNDRRPDRAVIAYANLIRRYFKKTAPLVLGGIEASLRRISHYDFWSNRLRRSILLDAKADYLLYGMADRSVVLLADRIRKAQDVKDIRGLCYVSHQKVPSYIELPAHNVVMDDKQKFIEMFHLFYRNNDPLTARGLCQAYDGRYLIQNPPSPTLTQTELDQIYNLPFERDLHPYYKKQGTVKALDTITFSIATHRGCYGECNFCAIAVHQGKTVQWRTTESILKEAEQLTRHRDFKGNLLDVGGPTANMYGYECRRKLGKGSCSTKRCVFPKVCGNLPVNHQIQIDLLRRLQSLPKVKKVFVASGIRYDMVINDRVSGIKYIREVAINHVSGQLKIAPEHSVDHVLNLMAKPEPETIIRFRELFMRYSHEAGKNQFLTYYFMAAHPGCTLEDMRQLKHLVSRQLKIHPEQVQIFTPTPSTYSTLMYYTGLDPFSGKPVFVEKDNSQKEKQKHILSSKGKMTHTF